MSDQNARPTEAEPTAPVDSPETGADTQQEIDWRKRAEDHQAAYTQGQEELARFREREQDLDYFRELAAKHGYQLQEEDEPEVDEYADPTETLRQEMEEFKQWREGLEQGAQQQAVEQRDVEYIGTALREFQEKTGRELTEEEIGLLGDAAWANRDENGVPRVADVLASYEQTLNAQQQRWAQTKKRAPHIAANGQAATQQKNVVDMTRQERQDWMTERVAANEQQ